MSRRRAAIHEAAHAVIGRVLKFDCGPASINPDGTGSAAVAAVHSLHWDYHERGGDILASVFDKITVCWAGPVAEDIKFGGYLIGDPDRGVDDRGDRRQIESLARRFYVSDQDVAAAHARARELVLLHWDKIEAVASALLEKQSLTGREIDQICNLGVK